MEKDIFAKEPTFTNSKGETLPLSQITNITSITVSYYSKEKKVKADGIKGMLGFKKRVQEEKELTVNDKSIFCYFTHGIDCVTIRFSSKQEFEKLGEDYDENTIFKRYVMTIVHPYQLNFHVNNIKKMEWTEKVQVTA